MGFIESIGVGMGFGIVNASLMFVVLFLARTNAKNRENDTLELMKERNSLDKQKVEAMRQMIPRERTCVEDVEDYIRSLQYADGTTEHERGLVAGNIRGFWSWLSSR